MRIDITDPDQLAGIEAAYAAYLETAGDDPEHASAKDYFQARCEDVARSYARQHVEVRPDVKDYIDANKEKVEAYLEAKKGETADAGMEVQP